MFPISSMLSRKFVLKRTRRSTSSLGVPEAGGHFAKSGRLDGVGDLADHEPETGGPFPVDLEVVFGLGRDRLWVASRTPSTSLIRLTMHRRWF